ncbi:MAG: hypothetical protein J6J43_02825 [Oscillospiraceae bacterium]|nr:hypothetical protein [Oscillospiraceae bacterium]
MKKYKYSYNIEKFADNEAFLQACRRIEQAGITDLQKEQLAVDVDGSLLQLYYVPHGRIIVFNDYYVGAVYVDSDIDLSHLFTVASF